MKKLKPLEIKNHRLTRNNDSNISNILNKKSLNQTRTTDYSISPNISLNDIKQNFKNINNNYQINNLKNDYKENDIDNNDFELGKNYQEDFSISESYNNIFKHF